MIGKHEKAKNDSVLAYHGVDSDYIFDKGYVEEDVFVGKFVKLFFQEDVKEIFKETLNEVAKSFNSYARNENTPRIKKMEISAGLENKAVIMNFYDKPGKNSDAYKINLIIGADVVFLKLLNAKAHNVRRETGTDIEQIREADMSKIINSKI